MLLGGYAASQLAPGCGSVRGVLRTLPVDRRMIALSRLAELDPSSLPPHWSALLVHEDSDGFALLVVPQRDAFDLAAHAGAGLLTNRGHRDRRASGQVTLPPARPPPARLPRRGFREGPNRCRALTDSGGPGSRWRRSSPVPRSPSPGGPGTYGGVLRLRGDPAGGGCRGLPIPPEACGPLSQYARLVYGTVGNEPPGRRQPPARPDRAGRRRRAACRQCQGLPRRRRGRRHPGRRQRQGHPAGRAGRRPPRRQQRCGLAPTAARAKHASGATARTPSSTASCLSLHMRSCSVSPRRRRARSLPARRAAGTARRPTRPVSGPPAAPPEPAPSRPRSQPLSVFNPLPFGSRESGKRGREQD